MKKVIILYMILTSFALAENVNSMKNKVKKIEREIKVKNNKIITIKRTENRTEKDLIELEQKIERAENEGKKLLFEIEKVKKRIDYGEKNLGVTSSELQRKKLEYSAKIISGNKFLVEKDNDLNEKPLLKKNFKALLYGDLEKMEKIKEVENHIKKAEYNQKIEKQKLSKLRQALKKNMLNMDIDKAKKRRLLKQLSRERQGHISSINRLTREKARIERRIKEIIINRSKQDKKIVKKSQAFGKLGKTLKPINGPIVVRFGQKKEGRVTSNGIEIAGTMGDVVRASYGGKVIYADYFQGLNQVVMIDYGYNMIGVYGNLIGINVRINQHVNRGAKIGILGKSINQKDNLYYELRFNLKPIDPVPMF